jgi:GTPase SAR1 family protein
MCEIEEQKITGVVMPFVSGAVGKSSLALTVEMHSLTPDWNETVSRVTKTQNLDFRFGSDHVHIDGHHYAVLHQYLVRPGQKDGETARNERSFEDVIDIYRSMIRRVDVVLLSYNITDLETFHEIEYWAEAVHTLINDKTNFIVVGTHLDKSEALEVTEQMVKTGSLV